ncbi:hypothetical protein T02_8705 [Trichinella nativa]|uniref:Uncharacterized protein n=1 Tax=Trichinella nativa TaxID=6335 RepID=A0A0V1L7C7_9BILA|nr:hypothetical protein T02_8705 [Trichinella nativa]
MDMVISLKPVSGQHGTRRLRRGRSPLTGRRAGGGAGSGRAEKKPCLSSHCWDPSKAAGPWYRNRERKRVASCSVTRRTPAHTRNMTSME